MDFRYTHINPGFIWDLICLHPDAVISTEMGFRSICALIYGFVFRRQVWIWWGGTQHTERNARIPSSGCDADFRSVCPALD